MPRRKPTAEQIRRDTSRLHAVKGAAMRDIKAIQALAKPKPAKKRAQKPARPAAPQGIRFG